MNAITMKNVQKIIGDTTVISDISLTIPKGAIYGFLGPNGAGKTTTIRLMLGLIKPTNGNIEITGQRLTTDQRAVLAQVGSLVEGPSLYQHLSGADNLRIAALMHNIPNKRIGEVLEIVNLSDSANKLTGQYSLGMKQRLGIAIALLHKPSLLILDEPTNGLDPAGIKDLRRLIVSFQRDHGMTVFLSSHLLSEIEQVATHIGIIHYGHLLFEGTKDALRAKSHPSLVLTTPHIDRSLTVLRSLKFAAEAKDQQVIIHATTDEEVAQIIKQLVLSGVTIYELRRIDNDLESIFMELTRSKEC